MIRREPLDHDMIIDRDLRIHIVIGSTHPPGRVFTYVKYIPAPQKNYEALWIFRGVPLIRVLERYSAAHLEKISRYHREEWDPVYGARMPSIGYLDIKEHLLPEERALDVYIRPRDSLEAIVSDLIERIRDYVGIPMSSIGVGGSILGSFHVVGRSDIDLIIYGCRNAEEIYEKAQELGKPLSGEVLERWAMNLSRLHSIPIEVARAMYSPYRRMIFSGVETTFVFPEDFRRYGYEIIDSLGRCVEIRAEIPGGQCTSLQYPGRAIISRVIDSPLDMPKIREVVLYEGTYSPILYRGGIVKIYGLVQHVMPSSIYRIAVGTRECKGYVIPENL